MDVVLDVLPGDAAFDREKTRASFTEFVHGLASTGDGATLTDIPKVCSQQFPDRPPMARCTADMTVHQWSITMSEAFFSFERIFLSDATMKKCLDLKGEWHAIPRDSEAFQEAQRRYNLGAARKLVDKAARAVE
jgi:hypothetical protein